MNKLVGVHEKSKKDTERFWTPRAALMGLEGWTVVKAVEDEFEGSILIEYTRRDGDNDQYSYRKFVKGY